MKLLLVEYVEFLQVKEVIILVFIEMKCISWQLKFIVKYYGVYFKYDRIQIR